MRKKQKKKTKKKKEKHLSKPVITSTVTFITIAVLATIAILFAEQYTFRDGRLVQTGMIDVKGADGAMVYKDGEEAGKAPNILPYIEEGTYTIRVEKEGKVTWEKSVFVVAGRVITLRPLLMPQDITVEDLGVINAVIPTDSSEVYFTVGDISGVTSITHNEITPGILGINRESTTIASLSDLNIRTNTLDQVDFIPSAKGKRIIIVDNYRHKVWLAEKGNDTAQNITDWFSISPFSETSISLKWTLDENHILVSAHYSGQYKISSINIRNEKETEIDISENPYHAIAVLDSSVVYAAGVTDNPTLQEAKTNGATPQIIDGPESGWGEITSIHAIEEEGLLLVETTEKIWKVDAEDEISVLAEGEHVIMSSSSDKVMTTCKTTGDGNSSDEQGTGTVYFFDPTSSVEKTTIKYPAPCNELLAITPTNTNQNLIFRTADSLIITTDDGQNTQILPYSILPTRTCTDTNFVLLSTICHKDDFVMRYTVQCNGEWHLQEIDFEN